MPIREDIVAELYVRLGKGFGTTGNRTLVYGL